MTERQKCLSTFQRLRVLEESTNGYAKCITCGKVYPVSELDGGHYIGRRHICTELEEDNVHAQCRKCNRFLNGDPILYRVKLIDKIGVERVERLENMLACSQGSETAKSRLEKKDIYMSISKKSEYEYELLNRELKKKLKELKKCKI